MREGGGSCEAQAVAVAEAILINRRSSFFATFAFFAAKTLESGWERDGPRGTRVLRGILTGQGAERDVARAPPPLLQGRGGLATSVELPRRPAVGGNHPTRQSPYAAD